MHSDANSIPGYGVVRDPPTYEDVDIVCVKHDPSGQIVYATVIGGQAGEEGPEDECLGCDITLDYISDEQGNVHVTGFTSSPNFPTLNAFQTSLLGAEDAFILSLDPTGALAFSSYMGGDDGEGHIDQDQGNAISTASDGSLLIGGTTASPDFLASTGISVNHLTPPAEGFDNFAMKLNPDRSIAFVSVWGGEDFDQINTIGTDNDGVIFTTGVTESSDYPVVCRCIPGATEGQH